MSNENAMKFVLDLPDVTVELSRAYVRDVLDPQIDELQAQLALLQHARSELARLFEIDRREHPTWVQSLIERAARAHFEGMQHPEKEKK